MICCMNILRNKDICKFPLRLPKIAPVCLEEFQFTQIFSVWLLIEDPFTLKNIWIWITNYMVTLLK